MKWPAWIANDPGIASIVVRFGYVLVLVTIVLFLEHYFTRWPVWFIVPSALLASVGPQLDIMRQDNERNARDH